MLHNSGVTNGRFSDHSTMYDRTVNDMQESDQSPIDRQYSSPMDRQYSSGDDEEKENDLQSNGINSETQLLQKGYALHNNWGDVSDKGDGGGGRTGRRKQSKPARVFQSLEGMETDQQDHNKPVDMSQRGEEEVAKEKMEVDEALPCDLCDATFNTQSSLTEHIQTKHDIGGEKNKDTFLTKYHQLGSELQQEATVFTPQYQDGPGEATTPPTTTPTNTPKSRSPDASPTEVSGSSSKSRIFHQDAYCKMCDREFCNKYFLKIHMANKHGVYEEGMGIMPGALAAASGEPPVAAPLTASLGKPVLQEPPLASLPPLPVLPPTPTSVLSTMSSASKSSGSSSKNSKPGPDMEDYCEICQKHFCNKYYLRKHKHDVHGIVPEALGSSGKKGRGSSSNNSSSQSGSSSGASTALPMTSAGPPPLMMPQQTPVYTSGAVNGPNPIPGLTSMSNVMFINPFAPPVAILQATKYHQLGNQLQQEGGVFPPQFPGIKQENPGETTPNKQTSRTPTSSANPPLQPAGLSFPLPPPGIPGMLPVQAATGSSRDSPKAPSSSSTSPTSKEPHSSKDPSPAKIPPVSLSPSVLPPSSLPMPTTEALRGMGLLGTEASCDICHKEFCNKYFLNIHKANKHSIFTEDGLAPLMLPGLPPGVPDGVSVRGGPELGETTPQKGSGKSESASGEGSPTGEEEVCEICQKEFSNKFSFKVHLLNAHNIKPHDNELFKLDRMNGGQNVHSTMFSNMIAAKLADRVTCDICNKEVCNKYFLKTHKMKVHGLSQMEVDMEAKTTPVKSASVAPTQPTTSSAVEAKEVLQRPNDDELLKMGIDPEAYCEICRKEFCSKYFLKTHKANIHGIKSDGGAGGSMGKADLNQKPLMIPQLQQLGLRQPLPPLMSGNMPLFPNSMPDLPLPLMSEKDKTSGQWKWKEPVNQTRVLCDICNKELCNKYFLKTHLMKRHGIHYDVMTGKSTAATPEMMTQFLASRDQDSSNDVAPSSASQTPQPTGSPDSKDNDKEEISPEDLTSVVSAKTWPVPSLSSSGKASPKPTSDAPQPTASSFALHKCQLCGLMFGELLALQFHMVRDHQGHVLVEPVTRKPSTANVMMRLKRKYRYGKTQRKLPRIVGSSTKLGPKKNYRCSTCRMKFRSRLMCRNHVNMVHKSSGKAEVTGNADKHVMQAFTLQEESSSDGQHFATWQVYLPVLRRISDPISASFTLTPAE